MGSTPDRWLEIRVAGLAGDDVTFAAESLVAAGSRGVQEEEDALVGYFPPPDDPDGFVAALRDTVEALSPEAALSWRWQDHRDWATLWRQGLGPRRVGERLVIRPSWTPYAPEEADLVLTLDPGIAFGTAEHGTTRNALRLLESRVAAGDRIADVGTGTGILAMAAIVLGAERAVAYDTDPWACEAARENARLNGVGGRMDVVEGSLPGEGIPFDGVVANIEWIALRSLLEGLVARTARGGWLILSGILRTERLDALERCGAQGLSLGAEVDDGEWWAVDLVRGGA